MHVEIDHGSRVGVVGDNGQGKTTFLRTMCGSLPPLAGEVTWGYGCQIGVYAQHVYTTLPENKTVLDYLEYQAAPGTNDAADQGRRRQLAVPRRDDRKADPRAQRRRAGPAVLAGLLLQKHNVLVLDEPGNHLDVETVEALAEALCRYEGTVIFTSHDRHFMHRVATHVIEVRDGRVASYPGSLRRLRLPRPQRNRLRPARTARHRRPAAACTEPAAPPPTARPTPAPTATPRRS